MEEVRKLATIRRIDNIQSIPDADKIVCATIGGWKLVTAIDNGFKIGDLVVYLEVDSWVPFDLAPFMSKGKTPREYNGVAGERLRTIKLRGQVSQGLILPLEVAMNAFVGSKFDDGQELIEVIYEDADVTELFGIQLWERVMTAQMAGMMKSSFPSWLKRTRQERIQNLKRPFEDYKARELTFEVSEKLEGSSMTVYLREDEFGVCSRRIDLLEKEGNPFWKAARADLLEESLRSFGSNIAIQGELVGPGVEENIYGLDKLEFRVFDVFDIDSFEYFSPKDRKDFCEAMDLKQVPILYENLKFNLEDTLDMVIEKADGKSRLAHINREGLVFKSNEVTEITFKVVSNKYLLKEK